MTSIHLTHYRPIVPGQPMAEEERYQVWQDLAIAARESELVAAVLAKAPQIVESGATEVHIDVHLKRRDDRLDLPSRVRVTWTGAGPCPGCDHHQLWVVIDPQAEKRFAAEVMEQIASDEWSIRTIRRLFRAGGVSQAPATAAWVYWSVFSFLLARAEGERAPIWDSEMMEAARLLFIGVLTQVLEGRDRRPLSVDWTALKYLASDWKPVRDWELPHSRGAMERFASGALVLLKSRDLEDLMREEVESTKWSETA